MKRLALVATMLFALVIGVSAQADLQPLVTIKLDKTETITLKQLKSKVELYQKQSGGKTFSVSERKQILDSMIDEKLITQAARKAGITLTDTQISQYFLMNVSQQFRQQFKNEIEFSNFIKKNTGLSVDDFMKQQLGMNLSDYKVYLKNQLTSQQYIIQQKGSDIQKVSATDAEIRNFYDLNKASFVQNDTAKVFLVVVPKGTDAESARVKANKMLNDLTAKKSTFDSIKTNAANDKTYQAGDLLIQKTAQHAQQLGITIENLNELFGKNVGYISTLTETPNDFQFYSVRQKYAAKMLSISDVVQPDTTVTVYDYIKQSVTAQKQQQALLLAVNDLVKTLDTKENVNRKKTGDALDKLLNW